MKRNEKLLAAVLGLFVVGWFAWPMVRSIFIDPVTTRTDEVDRLRSKVADQEQQEFEILLAERKLDEARRRGLPGNDLEAQRLYQQWLTELADVSGLNVQVTPNRRYSSGDVYFGIQVTLDGTATFSELQTFIRRFRETDLLQRIAQLDIESPAVEGDPELKITLIAEGLNLKGTPARSRLFPQIDLAEPLAADAAILPVSAKELNTKVGDLLRAESELLKVTSLDEGRLQVARGADGTTAAAHPAGSRVELLPIRKPGKDEPPIAVAAIDNPFVKPRRYEPKFDGFADATLVRGNEATMTVKVADYDRSAGDPQLELVSAPEGLSFDAASGKIAWTPADKTPAGDYKVTLAATVPAPEKRLEQTVTIHLKDPNTAPTLEPVAASEIFLGETLQIPLKAGDADGGTLDYAVEQGPPGATVDAATKEFRWSVPESFSPGDVSVTVVASDKGTPPLSAKQTFRVKVRENLKPFVHLSGTWLETNAGEEADAGSQKQAFLYDRSQNQWTRLREGRTFDAAGLNALVKEIGADFVTYERNGEIWKLRVGANLGQAVKIGGNPVTSVDPAAERPPVEADRPATEARSASPGPAAADPTPAT